MDVSFCVAALDEALAKYSTPEIFNTDQGSQFTSAAFTGALAGAGIKISMDGRRRWMDNVFIERLWRSLKHENIYLKGYAAAARPRQGSRAGSPSTTIVAFIRRTAIAGRWRSGASGCRSRRLWPSWTVVREEPPNR
ncbi:transposase family protein [Bradyrhizobium diazoefficiens]|nr:transposase family protein [Bradyrhizobium diazoefficiens]